jgi:hypothetical protein
MTMNEPIPCWRCGSKAIVERTPQLPGFYHVECLDTKGCNAHGNFGSRQEAVEWWGRRARPGEVSAIQKNKSKFRCLARSGGTGANDPQDCDYPYCGCDAPHGDAAHIEAMAFAMFTADTGDASSAGWKTFGNKDRYIRMAMAASNSRAKPVQEAML